MAHKNASKIKVFIDGEVLCIDHFSGIGHYTAGLLHEVDKLLDDKKYEHFEITIGTPWNISDRIHRFKFKNFKYKRMHVTPQTANGLKSSRFTPPIDLFFGKQIYVFPNFSSWPTLHSPIVPIIYDLSFVLHPEFSEERNRRFLTVQAKESAERAAHIVTISKNSKKELIENYDVNPEKISIIYPIIDKSRFYPRPKTEINHVRAKYGIFGKYILYVGNIEPRKNLISLLKAYDMIDQEKFKDYSLLLVGAKGWKDKEIHDLLKKLKNKGAKVVSPNFYVSDEDMPAVISGAEAFVYVSHYEGFGMPPVEAMHCAVPVISSDNSSLPEAVGEAAQMVDAKNVNQIKEALEKILSSNSLQKSLVQKGNQHIKNSMFNSRLIGKQFLSILEEINKQEAQL